MTLATSFTLSGNSGPSSSWIVAFKAASACARSDFSGRLSASDTRASASCFTRATSPAGGSTLVHSILGCSISATSSPAASSSSRMPFCATSRPFTISASVSSSAPPSTIMVVSGGEDSIVMVEGGALELTEAAIVKGLEVAQKGIRELLDAAGELVAEMQQPKMEWTKVEPPAGLVARVKQLAEARVSEALNLPEKSERAQALAALRATIQEQLGPEFPDNVKDVGSELEEIEYHTMRNQVLTHGERVDGRDLDTVRPISCEVGVLPRTHGSALFTRGQTQALVSVTLGTTRDEQRIDSIDVAQETTKSFMLHYNFPPFSTGEVKPIRGTSRREVGHGALAERAVQAVMPPYDQFPYTIRIVSDILESNGSSSMATVCGGSLALYDAGVPVTAACAGVAMGLIKEGSRVAVLTDILGTEDHLGDMDFKVAGTREGVTSIQMDIKIEGLDFKIIAEALDRAKQARVHILDIMDRAIPAPRSQLSKYAPRIITIQIPTEKIGDIIGPKGKTIRSIQEQTGAEINVDDNGLVTISAVGEGGARARDIVDRRDRHET